MQNKSTTHHLEWWQTLPWLFTSGISGLAGKREGSKSTQEELRQVSASVICLHHCPTARSMLRKRSLSHTVLNRCGPQQSTPAFLPPPSFSAIPAAFCWSFSRAGPHPARQLCRWCAPTWGGNRSPVVRDWLPPQVRGAGAEHRQTSNEQPKWKFPAESI